MNIGIALALTVSLVGCVTSVEDETGETAQEMTVSAIHDMADRCQVLVNDLSPLITVKPPYTLTYLQIQNWGKQDTLFAGFATQCNDFTASVARTDSAKTSFAEKLAAYGALEIAYEDLVSDVNSKSVTFQLLSNAAKVRHEAALNSIRNMK